MFSALVYFVQRILFLKIVNALDMEFVPFFFDWIWLYAFCVWAILPQIWVVGFFTLTVSQYCGSWSSLVLFLLCIPFSLNEKNKPLPPSVPLLHCQLKFPAEQPKKQKPTALHCLTCCCTYTKLHTISATQIFSFVKYSFAPLSHPHYMRVCSKWLFYVRCSIVFHVWIFIVFLEVSFSGRYFFWKYLIILTYLKENICHLPMY